MAPQFDNLSPEDAEEVAEVLDDAFIFMRSLQSIVMASVVDEGGAKDVFVRRVSRKITRKLGRPTEFALLQCLTRLNGVYVLPARRHFAAGTAFVAPTPESVPDETLGKIWREWVAGIVAAQDEYNDFRTHSWNPYGELATATEQLLEYIWTNHFRELDPSN